MLKYFLLGILTVYIIVPIIDSLLAIILALLELLKYYIVYKVSEIEERLTEEEPMEESRQIGFLTNLPKEGKGYDSEA